jgi:hypothetical protein
MNKKQIKPTYTRFFLFSFFIKRNEREREKKKKERGRESKARHKQHEKKRMNQAHAARKSIHT